MVRIAEIDAVLSASKQPNLQYLQDLVRNKRLAGVSDRSIANHLGHIHKFLCDVGYPDAAEITKTQIEDWYLAKREALTQSGTKTSPATLKGYLISIGVLMKHLHGVDTGRDMLSGIHVKVPLTNVREEELLTDAELQSMMRAATSERDRALLAVMYSSGARLGEIVGLNIGDVQVHKVGASLHVSGKTGERDVDIFVGVPELRAWLNVHPLRGDTSAPLFITRYPRGGGYSRLSGKAVQSLYVRLAAAAGISTEKRTNPHALRHKRATDVAEYLTTSDMREMLGWAQNSAMPNIYVHSSRKKVKSKLAKHAGIRVPETQTPTSMVHQCPVCGCINGANDLYCSNYYTILDEQFGRDVKIFQKFMAEEIGVLMKQGKKE